MNKNHTWLRWLMAGLAVAAVVAAAFVVAPLTSFAQSDSGSDTPATPAAPATPKAFGRGMGTMPNFDMGSMRTDHEKYLADALGITVEELQAAQEEAHAAMVAQLIEDGVITQEQADYMAARQAFAQYMVDANAQSLDDALKAAVEAGAITQEQADLLAQSMNQRGRAEMFGMFGGMMERGMRMFGDRDGGMMERGPQMFGDRNSNGGMYNRDFGGRGDFHHFGMPGMQGMPWDDNSSDDTTPQRGSGPQQSDSNL